MLAKLPMHSPAAFEGVPLNDAQKPKRAIVRIKKQDDRIKD